MGQFSRSEAVASIDSLIDLEKFPIHELDSAGCQALIQRCQTELAQTGCSTLRGFIRDEVLRALADEAEKLAPTAYHSRVEGNAYLEPVDASLPDFHPKRMIETTALGAVAYDQIPETSYIRTIYEWEKLSQFLAAVLGKPKLYRYADPMGALNIAVMNDGDYLRWHFDQTDFVTSIALQSSEHGGDFEFVPRIRSSQQENFDRVRALLKGSTEGVVRLSMEPGTLVLFEGRYSIHRVTEVKGPRARLVALLGYDTREGVTSSEHLQYMRYGRTAKKGSELGKGG